MMIKRTMILLSVLLSTGAITVGSYGFASSGSVENGFVSETDEPMMVVSDVIYDPSVEDKADVVSKEDAAVESEKVAVKSEEATGEDDLVVEDLAVETDFAETDFMETDYVSGVVIESETDWQSDQGGYEDIDSEGYDEDEEVSYIGSGYENANVDGAWISPGDFQYNGVHSDSSGWSYTYYSENVLPGGGLEIPGRHVDDEGYVCDADGNICIASDDLEYGTVVSVPFGSGTAVVYDSGSGSGNLDIYTSW